MGSGRWDSDAYAVTTASYADKTREEIFQSRSINEDLDPKHITVRESCDSDDNPNSTAIIIGLDVTGSMGFIPEKMAREGLDTLIGGIYERRPVSDPHVMLMAIGDIHCDRSPLQVTQFEADIRISEQLAELWLEGGGGGNQFESYDLPWAFAAQKTQIACFDKRGVKGYLFTIGDEMPPRTASKDLLQRKVNLKYQSEVTAEQLLKQAQEKYHVFHIIVEEGSYAKRAPGVYDAWKDLLDKRAILLDDHNHISQVVLSIIEVNEGAKAEEVIARWEDENVQRSVRRALFGPSQS